MFDYEEVRIKKKNLAFLGGLTFIISISLVLMTTTSVSCSGVGSDFLSFPLFFSMSPFFSFLFWLKKSYLPMSNSHDTSDFESLHELEENNKC